MLEMIGSYIYSFFHPVETQRAYQFLRVKGVSVNKYKYDLASTIMVSWLFNLIQGMYALLALYLGAQVFNDVTNNNYLFSNYIEFYGQKITMYVGIIEVILFPLSAYILCKFWGVMIRFFCRLFDKDENTDDAIEQILCSYMTCSVFELIPIFGHFLRHLVGIVYLYSGIKNNIGLSSLQAIVIVLAPLMIFGLMILFLIFFIYSFVATL